MFRLPCLAFVLLAVALLAGFAPAQVYFVPAPRFAAVPVVAPYPTASYRMECAGGVCRYVQVAPTATVADSPAFAPAVSPIVIYHDRGILRPRFYSIYP